MINDLGFPQNYECEVLEGLPGIGPLPLQFHREGQRSHRQGLAVRVQTSSGQSWIGNFQKGNEGISGSFGFPCEEHLCVVSKGQGYIVNVEQPNEYKIVPLNPIKEVCSVPGRLIVVFADYTRLAAYGPNGILWTTKGLSWDGIRIIEVTSDHIKGIAWDAPKSKDTEFLVNVQSGQYTGAR